MPKSFRFAAGGYHSPHRSAMDAAKVYLDLMSQPCRTVAIFCRCFGDRSGSRWEWRVAAPRRNGGPRPAACCRLNALPVEEVAVNIGKGETRSEAFKGVNPVGKLPALVDADGFHLSESASLLRYLCDTRSGLPDHWYPGECKGGVAGEQHAG